MNALQRFLNAWGDYWPDDQRTLDLTAKLRLAEMNSVSGWSEARRAAAERDMALRTISEMRAHPSSQPAPIPVEVEQAVTILSDTIANSHLRERNDLLEAEVEHYRNEAQRLARRLTQMGEPTRLAEYGETVA